MNFQPDFPHSDLVEAVHELERTTPVTTPENVLELRGLLAAIGTGELIRPIVITGSCHEDVDLRIPTQQLASEATAMHNAVTRSDLNNPLVIMRNRGQNTKPRSNQFENTELGKVVSFMGHAVNEDAFDRRAPDPSRMVSAALQARDLEEQLTDGFGSHVPSAHEALLLAYELAFLKDDLAGGGRLLLSTDLPWLGVRTNQADGVHAQILAGIENSIGAKLGESTTAEDIAALKRQLNPSAEPGKMVYMPRFGLASISKAQQMLKGIGDHDPNAIILYDLHGSTRSNEDGAKVRVVSEIIEEIELLADACKQVGLQLHGVHLETMHDDSRLECVDHPMQVPTHSGNVDPRLNPRQTTLILNAVANILPA